MKNRILISTLIILIALISGISAYIGISSNAEQGLQKFKSVRGQDVCLYGKGVYHDMSAEVAPQGIAQDYVTLFLSIPCLIISLFFYLKNSLRALYVLSGTILYFLLTYLFYLMMCMYNYLFLAYVLLLSLSFFSFLILLSNFKVEDISRKFTSKSPITFSSIYLMFNSILIALLWLSVIIPPLFDGSIIPKQTEHYTTLVVQGLDLSLFLPMGFISGLAFLKRKNYGYVLCPIYYIFLSILMTALTAKIIAMYLLSYNVIPVIFIIPTFNVLLIIISGLLLKNLKEE